MVQAGESASQATVFEAHAVPQSPCENLISALKLLGNQQKDGDSPIQSIVTGLCERRYYGGLKNLKKVDSHCAVGHLKEGTRSLRYEGQNVKKGALRC